MVIPRFFRGNSGCSLCLLTTDAGIPFVRKTSASVRYNERLRKQQAKQRQFRSAVFRAPEIYADGVDGNDLYFFDMELVAGAPMHQAILRRPAVASDLLDKVNTHISSASTSLEDCTDAFRGKIEDLCREPKIEALRSSSPSVAASLDRLQVQSWASFPVSRAHGDLTLENIILADSGDIYLVDFLDSFVESYLFDIAKLLQDFEVHWSFRDVAPDELRRIDFESLKRELMSLPYLASAHEPDELERMLRALVVLNCLRILPYMAPGKEAGLLASLERLS